VGRAIKWIVSVTSAIVVFPAALWIGYLAAPAVVPASWADTGKLPVSIAFATLSATVAFGISKWWAEKSADQTKVAARSQVLKGSVRASRSSVAGNIANSTINVNSTPHEQP
jgi:hypothetical protein